MGLFEVVMKGKELAEGIASLETKRALLDQRRFSCPVCKETFDTKAGTPEPWRSAVGRPGGGGDPPQW